MVGVSYSNIKPGEVCYVVVKTPQGQSEYLEGQFVGVFPEEHSAWKRVKTKNFPDHGRSYAKPVQAIITDPVLEKRGMDPLALGQEPFRDYEVISRREYVSRVRTEIKGLQAKLAEARNDNVSVTEDLTTRLQHLAGQSAVEVEYLQQENQVLQRNVARLPWVYLVIGAAFGIAACLGAAAYQNYRSVQKAADSLEIRIEQP